MTEAQLGAAIDDVESRIAACMSGAGFEYVAADIAAVRAAMAAVGSAPGLADADYVAQYGYGIATQFDNPAGELGLGAANRAIIAALSPTDQAAYRFALLGEHQDAAFAVTLDNEDFSQALAQADLDCATNVLDPVIANVESEVFGEPQG